MGGNTNSAWETQKLIHTRLKKKTKTDFVNVVVKLKRAIVIDIIVSTTRIG